MRQLILFSVLIFIAINSYCQDENAIPIDCSVKAKICNALIEEFLRTYTGEGQFYYSVEGLPDYRSTSIRAIHWSENDLSTLDTLHSNSTFSYYRIEYFERAPIDSAHNSCLAFYVRIFKHELRKKGVNDVANSNPFITIPHIFGQTAYLRYDLKTKEIRFINWVRQD